MGTLWLDDDFMGGVGKSRMLAGGDGGVSASGEGRLNSWCGWCSWKCWVSSPFMCASVFFFPIAFNRSPMSTFDIP